MCRVILFSYQIVKKMSKVYAPFQTSQNGKINFNSYRGSTPAHESIAIFHAHDFQPAYIPKCGDQLLNSLTMAAAGKGGQSDRYLNGWFGPMYGVDVHTISSEIAQCPYRKLRPRFSCPTG